MVRVSCGLYRLLGVLLSKNLDIDKRLQIIETEYYIPVEEKMREEVGFMCNLGEGIWESAQNEIILNMYKKGYTLEQIADVTEKSTDEVRTIIDKEELALV